MTPRIRTLCQAVALVAVATFAGPAVTSAAASTDSTITQACNRYLVNYTPAPVRSQPWRTAPKLKDKSAGEYVTGPVAIAQRDPASGWYFTPVYTSVGPGGLGWMRTAHLGYPINWNC